MNKNVFGDSVTDVYDKCGETGFCEMKKGDICTLGSPCPHQKPLTNEEYISTAPTTDDIVAELCKMDSWIKKKMKEEIGSYNKFMRGDYYREWLKQPHREIGK